MFRAMFTPIFRRNRLCVTACGIMHPQCCRPVAWKRRNSASRLPTGIIPVHYTTSCNTQCSGPEDGRNHRPKHIRNEEWFYKSLQLFLVVVVQVMVVYRDHKPYSVSGLFLRLGITHHLHLQSDLFWFWWMSKRGNVFLPVTSVSI